MAMTTRAAWRVFVGALLAGSFTPLALVAQSPIREPGKDLLDETRRRLEIAAQKAEADVRAALLEAQRPTTSPEKAVALLKNALAQLEAETALTPQRKQALVRVLQDRIRVMSAEANRLPGPMPSADRRPTDRSKNDDQAEITLTLKVIADLQKERKFAEARRLAEDLARRHPDNPAVQAALNQTRVITSNVTGGADRSERDQRTNRVLNDVAASATPPIGDIEFPKDWKERIAKRTHLNAVKLTEKEKAILQGLGSAITVNYKNSRFEDVIEHIATVIGQPILLDPQAIKDAGVDYETPITVSVKGVAVRTLLHKILGEFGLTYVVHNEAIQIVSALKAREMMTTRTYYIGDMFDAAMLANPFLAQQMVNSLIDTIQTVAPESWKVNGGLGTVTYNPVARALVIRQSAEVHAILGSQLR